jgi:hypothetical protein
VKVDYFLRQPAAGLRKGALLLRIGRGRARRGASPICFLILVYDRRDGF